MCIVRTFRIPSQPPWPGASVWQPGGSGALPEKRNKQIGRSPWQHRCCPSLPPDPALYAGRNRRIPAVRIAESFPAHTHTNTHSHSRQFTHHASHSLPPTLTFDPPSQQPPGIKSAAKRCTPARGCPQPRRPFLSTCMFPSLIAEPQTQHRLPAPSRELRHVNLTGQPAARTARTACMHASPHAATVFAVCWHGLTVEPAPGSTLHGLPSRRTAGWAISPSCQAPRVRRLSHRRFPSRRRCPPWGALRSGASGCSS